MGLDERLRDLENKHGANNYYVINLYSHLSKAQCIKEYENGNDKLYPSHVFRQVTKIEDDAVIYWVYVLPDYFKFEQIEWMNKHKKEIENLIDNYGYSLDRVYDEHYKQGF